MPYRSEDHAHTNWLRNVPPAGRVPIRRIIESVEGEDRTHRRTHLYYRWSVLLTPSVGMARDVELIARTGDHREHRWHIMQSGRVV